uniref:Reverse transcriptase Ty1/copia-type domain-containing protein n=1 Tax=Tanacetum cinerariifolium TaxID=118510 RepID=A0A6L2KRB9_TANCI|nr:hypothetical protein [Tanacetum cinerariifolium]
MQEELNEFERLGVWELIPRPDKVMVITLKWIYKVKLDELGGILKNKARGYKDILAFAAHMNLVVYQMDVKTTILNCNPREEVYVSQSDGFVDPDNPNHVYTLKKALYGLKQAPRACQNMPLKKYGFDSCDPVDTPMVEKSKLDEDKEGKIIDLSHYCGMIGTLLYLIATFAYADHAGCQDTRRSISGGMQFLGERLHSRSKHIDIRFYFIKGHVENGVIELYFVNTEYQLEDIFTKALARERIELLINKLRMRSFTLETLKQLADDVEE